jgi:phosphoglycerol transferase MdoB-like AlkP superfamily enzyme
VRWWPENNYVVNGFTAGFLMSLDVLQIPRPPATAARLPAECEAGAPAAIPVAAPAAPTRPDVIVLLLESFFDPLTLGIPFSRDPIPFLRTMMDASGDAELHSTLWAHGTANAEFEILTGLSTAFLPPDSVVFFHYLHGPLRSLATELRAVGYRAEAVHPNAGWFYARHDAYRWLGFDRAWFEEDFIAPREARARISDDRAFFAKLRERLDGADDTPRFLWGVTLGTHGPYAPARAAHCDLRVGADADPHAPGRFPTLRTYACLLERLDRRLREFVEALETRGKPYVLFAYGDHLPPLGAELDAYRDVIGGDAAHGGPRFSRTPLLLATNTAAPLPRGYHGGFNFLAPAILRAAGVVPRCQFALLDPLHARVDLVHAGLLAPGAADASLQTEVTRYWAVTYHLLLEGTS